MQGRMLMMGVVLLVSGGVRAELEVIHDSGDTRSIEPFMKPMQEDERERAKRSEGPRRPPGADETLERRLPISTPNMEVGRLRGQPGKGVAKRLRRLRRPFCVVGTDKRSVRWLDAHRSALERANVGCLAVEVPDRDALERLMDVSGNVPVTAVSGSNLAEKLEISVYPVLITRDGFEQ